MKRFPALFGFVLTAGLFFFGVQAAAGADMTKKWGVSLRGGAYKLGLTDHSDIWNVGVLANPGIKYGLGRKLAVGAEGSWMQTNLDDKAGDGQRQRAFIGGVLAEYHFTPEKSWSPYIQGGSGIYIWRWISADGRTLRSMDVALAGTGIPEANRVDSCYDLKDRELYGMVGLGVQFFPSKRLAFELGGKFRYLTHLLTNFKGDNDIVGSDSNQLDLPRTTVEAYAGLSYYFGGKMVDDDRDGVGNKKDRCPNTPAGCRVDGDGCPIDSDADGVCDGQDQCPDTPRGARVDGKGCPVDADQDGVSDGLDDCPNTPKGCPVDATGCPKDEDGDGVCDVLDKCGRTPKECRVDGDGCPIDLDADGVCDGLDNCPNTLKGCRVDAAGCPKDEDGDGVCDGLDKCGGTSKGCRVDADGCPIDADDDGVCDGIDRCPNTPAGSRVDVAGCVVPTVEYIPTPGKPLILKGVNFEVNQAVLLEDSKKILDEAAASLAAHPEVTVEIGGHTDADGSDARNLQLSEDRAKAVRDYLLEKGVKRENLLIRGYGETRPIDSNETKAGRAKNRRVELTRVR